MAVQGIKSLGYELTPGGSGPDFGDDRFTPGLDWWNSISPRMDRYEQIMPRDPKAAAEVDAIRRKLSDPQWNPEKYKGSVVPAAAPGDGADMRQPDASAVMGDTPEKGRTVMHYVLDHVAKRGRNGDDTLTHASKGDLNIPVESIQGKFKSELDALLKKHKIDRDRYTVGAKGNSVHPETGLPEFFGDTGAGDPGGAAGDPSGADMGGGQGGSGPSSGGDKSGGQMGSGGGGQTDTGPSNAASAEATGSLSGISDVTAPSLADKIGGFISGQIQSVQENPGGFLANTLTGMVPGLGPANAVSGLVGGPTVGSVLGAHGVDQPGNPGGTGDPGAGPATAGGPDPVLDLLMRQLNGFSLPPGPR